MLPGPVPISSAAKVADWEVIRCRQIFHSNPVFSQSTLFHLDWSVIRPKREPFIHGVVRMTEVASFHLHDFFAEYKSETLAH